MCVYAFACLFAFDALFSPREKRRGLECLRMDSGEVTHRHKPLASEHSKLDPMRALSMSLCLHRLVVFPFTIVKNGSIWICLVTPAVLYAVEPFSLVLGAKWIMECSFSVHHVGLPLAFIFYTVRRSVSPEPFCLVVDEGSYMDKSRTASININ